MEIRTRNVNSALAAALRLMQKHGELSSSRNGEVLVFPEPVMITYTHPRERVLFSPLRDANPFFQLLGDALWCLAGRQDVAFPAYFNKQFLEYTDDGVTHPGAYGYRWRSYFDYDQLQLLTRELKANPDTRRAVLAMWDGGGEGDGGNWPRLGDLQRSIRGTKDAPCNTHAYFDCRGGRLNLTVCQRSGDLWWGTLGANAVQFSVLLEYMAFAVGLPMGEYRQFVNNLHLYTSVVPRDQLVVLALDADMSNLYPLHGSLPLINTDIKTWEADLQLFMKEPAHPNTYEDEFFRTAYPMYKAWQVRKLKIYGGADMKWAELIASEDWRLACKAWIRRRER